MTNQPGRLRLAHWTATRFSRGLRYLVPPPRPGLRILMYHSIRQEGTPIVGADAVPAGMFEAQMRWLREESRLPVLSLGHGVERLGGAAFDTNAVAVTFDDGYLDALTVAAPILQRYEIPFTTFVITSFLANPPVRSHYLDVRALRELASVPGAAIGAHGHSHCPLTRLDEGTMSEELHASASFLADTLGARPAGLSYPYGAVDARVVLHARAAGFTVGATSIEGANRPGAEPMLLRRTEIAGTDGLVDFANRLQGYFDWYRLKQRIYRPVPPLTSMKGR